MRILFQVRCSIEWSPLRLVFEESHRFDVLKLVSRIDKRRSPKGTYIFGISRETVPDAGWQDDEIVLFNSNPNPLITIYAASHVEETLPVEDISDLLVLMQVLLEEHLHLVLIHLAHTLRGDCDLIAVLVRAFFGNVINILYARTVVIEDSQI